MKPDFPPPPPGDEATDPLLAALRQRLGDYGQAPPPGAWAAIRRQVAPAALPQPWWRRRAPLVLLGLLLCCLLPARLGEYASQYWAGFAVLMRPSPSAAPAAGPFAAAAAPGVRAARRTKTLATGAGRAVSPGAPASGGSSEISLENADFSLKALDNKPDAAIKAARPRAATAGSTATHGQAVRQLAGTKVAEAATAAALSADAVAKAPRRRIPRLAAMLADNRPRRSYRNPAASRWPVPPRPPAREVGAAGPRAMPGATGQSARRAHQATAAASRATRAPEAASKITTTPAATPEIATISAARRGARARPRAAKVGRAASQLATIALQSTAAPTDAVAPAATLAVPLASSVFPFGPLDSLALKPVALWLPALATLPVLVARPDSTPPPLPVRRWALLVVAGPTVSYRTLGPAPTLAAGHPDFARLERPALGLGAQVQMRRVLSGRWALAMGVGYHEYATGLALSLKDTASVHQRDTYRLLTVPVQLGYALGAPTGRLSKGLLLGIEPGWYLGGRSTEGSGCGCEQQAYSSAGGSPYRPLTVALSLGLDVRYRLGGAGGRWQWLVQPTGRYVATPFVRAGAVGFTQRQPFSLGLLTGFSWDVR